MSVIVMGVDIPEDCDSCWLPGKHCNLWLATDVGERHRGCPIRPLPEKHGRLIDADALAEDLRFDVEMNARLLDEMDFVGKEREHIQQDKDCKQNCIYYIEETSTIVEAEGE